MSSSSDRPPHFPPGTPVGDRYAVEGLVRLAEGRMFYLVNDDRPDQPTRRCQECGTDCPRDEATCPACGSQLKSRRFLLSTRWNPEAYPAYQSFAELGLEHPGLASPVDVLVQDGQLLSVIPYQGEGLMLDESSPLSNQHILDLAQRLAGTLAFLHHHGVQLAGIGRSNLLISPDNSVRLYDLEVVEVHSGPVPESERAAELVSVADLLRQYCDVEAEALVQFMETATAGTFDSPASFGRSVESRFDALSSFSYPQVLGGMSDVGLTRQLNEDSWGWRKISPRANLYVVADGMGGHDGGEVASALAVETIVSVARQNESLAAGDLDQVEALLDTSFQAANNTIKDHADEKGNDMGTTLVALLVLDGQLGFFANVGDSRAYLLRNRSLHQVTRDHSLVAKMVERGRITAEEARTHPHSNILLRTVGTERDVDIDIFRVEFESGDRVIMCSDGLWGEVEDRDMESILNTYADPRIAVRELVRAAHHGGGKDNVTVTVVAIP